MGNGHAMPVSWDAEAPCPFIGKICPKATDKCRFWVTMPYAEAGVLGVKVVQKEDCAINHLIVLGLGSQGILMQAVSGPPRPPMPPGKSPLIPPGGGRG